MKQKYKIKFNKKDRWKNELEYRVTLCARVNIFSLHRQLPPSK